MTPLRRWPEFAVALALLATVLWLRWLGLGAGLWNVDEAIHAAAARTLLDGGVLYRDAVDQRTPLSYYAVAGVFSLCGENNLWAVRAGVAGLIAATAFLLFLAGRSLRGLGAGLGAATLYAVLPGSVLFQGDANAVNTEWFVAFFSAAAAAVFLAGGALPSARRLAVAGCLLGCSFLSKQPALLDLAAPVAALLYVAWRQPVSCWLLAQRLLALAAGWLAPVAVTWGYFAARGAGADLVFYAWTYNLSYYGPEITTADRLASLFLPFRLIGAAQPWVLVLWTAGAIAGLHRVLQRQPTPAENSSNPGLVFLATWTLAALAGTTAGGRGFDHYSIQFLAPFCLGGGLALARLSAWARSPAFRWPVRATAAVMLAAVLYGAGATALSARRRTLPEDASRRVSAYIRDHSAATDRIFVWGFHPDIYLYADRRPASRYLYASFVTGLIPWTNTAPERDTTYAIVPGALDHLLRDLSGRSPVFIVDCSAGPNRHWQKYPLEKFPALRDFIHRRYHVVESGRFAAQGFRLFQLRPPGETLEKSAEAPALPAEIAVTLRLGLAAIALEPVRVVAPYGAGFSIIEGRADYFAHAPSSLLYRLPAGGGLLRGGYGLRPGAYAPDNRDSTDGAEFVILWRPAGGGEQVLLRRLLHPREEPADRGLHFFRIELPADGGELELATNPGPARNPTADWTYWSDLLLERFP